MSTFLMLEAQAQRDQWRDRALRAERKLTALSSERDLLREALAKARPYVCWHTRPGPENVKDLLAKIDAAFTGVTGG